MEVTLFSLVKKNIRNKDLSKLINTLLKEDLPEESKAEKRRAKRKKRKDKKTKETRPLIRA